MTDYLTFQVDQSPVLATWKSYGLFDNNCLFDLMELFSVPWNQATPT